MTAKEALRKEYQKQRNRINRFMRVAEKRGYIFDEGLLPPPPKRITKASIRRLAKINPDFLYHTRTTLNQTPASICPLSVAESRNARKQQEKPASQTQSRKTKE